MLVKDLVKYLSQCNEDAEVVFADDLPLLDLIWDMNTNKVIITDLLDEDELEIL
jgi:hypothetical protein